MVVSAFISSQETKVRLKSFSAQGSGIKAHAHCLEAMGHKLSFCRYWWPPEGEVGERVGLTSTPYGRCLVIYMSQPEFCHTYEPMSANRQTQPHVLFYKLNETGPILGPHTTNSIKGSVEANETTS